MYIYIYKYDFFSKLHLFICVLQDEIKYSITGDDVAMQYFYMNPDTGVVTLNKLLTDGTDRRYNVRTNYTPLLGKYYIFLFIVMLCILLVFMGSPVLTPAKL